MLQRLLCTTCPKCGMPPGMALGVETAFCMNEECNAIFWDMTVTAETNLAHEQVVMLTARKEEKIQVEYPRPSGERGDLYQPHKCKHAPDDGCEWCCQTCNYDRHRCPGCGTVTDHKNSVCPECITLGKELDGSYELGS